MDKGAKVVAKAIIGEDDVQVCINDKIYSIMPPTIAKIAGAAVYLSDLQTEGKDNLADAVQMMKNLPKAAVALSWFIKGDVSLSKELMKAKSEEVIGALMVAVSMVSPENFTMLSDLVKSVLSLIAKPKSS